MYLPLSEGFLIMVCLRSTHIKLLIRPEEKRWIRKKLKTIHWKIINAVTLKGISSHTWWAMTTTGARWRSSSIITGSNLKNRNSQVGYFGTYLFPKLNSKPEFTFELHQGKIRHEGTGISICPSFGVCVNGKTWH